MDKLILFFWIIAWIAAPISSLLLFVCIYLNIQYPGSADELMDKIKGVERTYPILWPLIVAVIGWAFIITFC